jgi:hypothetical protein
MSAPGRYTFDEADVDSIAVRDVRVRHIFRRVAVPPVSDGAITISPQHFAFVLRALFGSRTSRRAARLLNTTEASLSRYTTRRARIPRRLWHRLRDDWSELERYRRAEIATRQREFAAIIEQEEALIIHARKLVTLAVAEIDRATGYASPDSPLLSARIRHRHRRREMLLREPQAALALSILFPKPSAGAER